MGTIGLTLNNFLLLLFSPGIITSRECRVVFFFSKGLLPPTFLLFSVYLHVSRHNTESKSLPSRSQFSQLQNYSKCAFWFSLGFCKRQGEKKKTCLSSSLVVCVERIELAFEPRMSRGSPGTTSTLGTANGILCLTAPPPPHFTPSPSCSAFPAQQQGSWKAGHFSLVPTLSYPHSPDA